MPKETKVGPLTPHHIQTMQEGPNLTNLPIQVTIEPMVKTIERTAQVLQYMSENYNPIYE